MSYSHSISLTQPTLEARLRFFELFMRELHDWVYIYTTEEKFRFGFVSENYWAFIEIHRRDNGYVVAYDETQFYISQTAMKNGSVQEGLFYIRFVSP